MGGNGVWVIDYLPPHLIWKAPSESGPIVKEATKAAEAHGMTAAVSSSGWTTGHTFLKWLEHHLVDLHRGKRRLLILHVHLDVINATASLLFHDQKHQHALWVKNPETAKCAYNEARKYMGGRCV